MLSTFLSYVPNKLLQELELAAPVTSESASQRSEGVLLFADISGFTNLTERMNRKGDEGPEEITRVVNLYFQHTIALIKQEGGDVMGFGGDSILVLFEPYQEVLGQTVRRAWQTAQKMQTILHDLNPLQTSVGPVTLGLKVGIGAGMVRTMRVGGVYNRCSFVLAGNALEQATAAEGWAERGDIVLSPEAQEVMTSEPVASRALQTYQLPPQEHQEALQTRLRRYLPKSMQWWITQAGFEEGIHDWMGVLRTMSVLFVGVRGIDYQEEDAVDQLHTFTRRVLRTIYRYQGSLCRLAVDDKGTNFLILFGTPPFAHTDDAVRIVRCALDLQQAAQAQSLQIKAGITTGHMFAGAVGGQDRREYTVMGDVVNMAARLMSKAEPGTTLCSTRTHALTKNQFLFHTHPPTQLKGKAEPVPLYQPYDLVAEVNVQEQSNDLIGLQEPLEQILAHADTAQSGAGEVVLVTGETGTGKSRLLRALRETLEARSFVWLQGSGSSLEQQSGYWAWRRLFQTFFDTHGSHTEANFNESIREVVKEYAPDKEALLPLLNGLLDVSFPETQTTLALDGELRKENLTLLLLSLLRKRSQTQPLCIVIDDAHWLDSVSRDMVLQFAQSFSTHEAQILFLVSSRPIDNEENEASQFLQKLALLGPVEHVAILPLSFEQTTDLIAARLKVSPSQVPDSVRDFIYSKSDGNPFIVEEMLILLQDQKLLEVIEENGQLLCKLSHDFEQVSSLLPSSLEGVLLARLDQIPPQSQLVLKIASVIGQDVDSSALRYAFSSQFQEQADQLEAALDKLRQDDFLAPADSEEGKYTFKNDILHKVVYRSLLYQQRRKLHRSLAEWYEKNASLPFSTDSHTDLIAATASQTDIPFPVEGVSQPSTLYSVLARHWQGSGEERRERHYVQMAAQAAKAQYANTEAVEYLTRAIALTPAHDTAKRYQLYLEREGLYARLGERAQQQLDLEALQTLAQGHRERELEVALRQMDHALAMDDYEPTLELAQATSNQAKLYQLPKFQAEAERRWGWSLYLQGKLPEARQRLTDALHLAQECNAQTTEAAALRNLGSCEHALGQLDEALARYQAALFLCHQLNEGVDEAGTFNNIGLVLADQGKILEAVEHFRHAHKLFHTLGSRRGIGVALGNVGYYSIKLGDFENAQSALLQVLNIGREIGHKASESFATMTLGECYVRLGQYKRARQSIETSVLISRAIGNLFFEGYGLAVKAEVLCAQRDFHRANKVLKDCLEVAEKLQDPHLRASALYTQGNVLLGQEQADAARDVFDEATQLFEENEMKGEALDSRAGVARSYLALGQPDQALQALSPFLELLTGPNHAQSLAEHLQQTLEPMLIALTAVQVLEHRQLDLAKTLCTNAVSLLQERAHRIQDPQSRATYLHEVPHHQQLLACG